MKKRFFDCIAMMMTVLLISFSALTPKSLAAEVEPADDNAGTVLTSNTTAGLDKVQEARFLNMLNHNYVYDECFNNVEDIVNNSILALLDKRDVTNDSFIAENYVRDYVFNMYGINITDFSQINVGYFELDGYVYIIPRGYTTYQHTIKSVTKNNDGSFTVITNVTVSAHDAEDTECTAETLFVKNENSQFGYNIIYSDLNANYAMA